MQRTGIEYLTHTWNPLAMRCTPISEGCRNCWHIRMCKRHAANPHFTEEERAAYAGHNIVLREKELNAPLRLRKPARIGVQFMGDLFLEGVGLHWQEHVWDVMEATPQHTYIVLTKRAELMLDTIEQHLMVSHGVLPNAWLGVTAENRTRASERIPLLLQCPAAVRFVSAEPMLGPIRLPMTWYSERHIDHPDFGMANKHRKRAVDWVIVGGETGPGARPMHPAWARGACDQCKATGTPFYFKQVGMWAQEFIPTAKEWAIYSPVAGGWNYIRDKRTAEHNAEYGFTVWSRLSKQPPIPDDLMVREYPEGMVI